MRTTQSSWPENVEQTRLKFFFLESQIDPVWWPFPNKISGPPSEESWSSYPHLHFAGEKSIDTKKKIWKVCPPWVEILQKLPQKNIIGKSINDRLIILNDKVLSAKLIFSFVGWNDDWQLIFIRSSKGFLWYHCHCLPVIQPSMLFLKKDLSVSFFRQWNFVWVKNIKLCLKHFLYVRHTWLTLFAIWSGSHSREVWRVRSVRRGRKVKRAKNVRRMRKGRRRVSCGRRDVKFANI